MRIMVTGGAGFLGSHLCERLLLDGHKVTCLDNFETGHRGNIAHLEQHPRFRLLCHDVTKPFTTVADQVYHLACPASPVSYQRYPVETIRTAVCGTINVLDAARVAGARVLIASTSEIYGDPAEHPQTESYRGNVSCTGARACYDEGKRCAEALAVSYQRQHGVDARIARIFNTYGPRMSVYDGRVVSNLVTQALLGLPLTIYGHGRQTRSFCYVSDMVEGLVRLMNTEVNPGPVNLGSEREIPIAELARMVTKLGGSTASYSRQPLPADDPARRKPGIDKARGVLGWLPIVSLEQGLLETIRYFSDHTRTLSKSASPFSTPSTTAPCD